MNDRETLKRRLKNLKSVAIFLIITLSITYFLPKALSLIFQAPYPMAVVTSSSMWPTLAKGDLVFIRGTNGKDIKVGDVIAFYGSTSFTMHRVVEVKDGAVITKGDANVSPDGPIDDDRIIGKVITVGNWLAKIPYLGYISILTQGEFK